MHAATRTISASAAAMRVALVATLAAGALVALPGSAAADTPPAPGNGQLPIAQADPDGPQPQPQGPGEIALPDDGGTPPTGPGDFADAPGGQQPPTGPGDFADAPGGGSGDDGEQPGDAGAEDELLPDERDLGTLGDTGAGFDDDAITAQEQAIASAGADAELPYTGAETWIVTGVGALLTLLGASSWGLATRRARG